MANIGKEVHQGVEFELRSTPLSRLTLNASYSFLNRDIAYDFGSLPNVSAVNTSISILPTLPKNKAIGTITYRLPHEVPGDFEGTLREWSSLAGHLINTPRGILKRLNWFLNLRYRF